MTQTQSPAQPQAAAPTDHRLAWIAMIVMAGMCAGVLVWAASLPAG